jgi:protein tyrosine phosphatase (PTP) superfamily phosphohydrolase (DUF442 family)
MRTILLALLCTFAAITGAQDMGTQTIRNYRKVDERHATAGQPSEEHLKAAAAEGYGTIINLATIDPRYSLEDEGASAAALGMKYHHIPVPWDRPSDEDFAAFEKAMQSAGASKTLVHCAANYRATAFYALYAMKHLGWSRERAEAFRASVWKGSDFPVWEEFIQRTQSAIEKK